MYHVDRGEVQRGTTLCHQLSYDPGNQLLHTISSKVAANTRVLCIALSPLGRKDSRKDQGRTQVSSNGSTCNERRNIEIQGDSPPYSFLVHHLSLHLLGA
jgi:hypothetical protein